MHYVSNVSSLLFSSLLFSSLLFSSLLFSSLLFSSLLFSSLLFSSQCHKNAPWPKCTAEISSLCKHYWAFRGFNIPNTANTGQVAVLSIWYSASLWPETLFRSKRLRSPSFKSFPKPILATLYLAHWHSDPMPQRLWTLKVWKAELLL